MTTQKTGEDVREEPSEVSGRKASCTHHCATCDRHFSSLSAFDAHRRGEFEPESTIEGRHCVPLNHLPEAQAANWKTRSGFCDLTKGSSRLENVPIWGSAKEMTKEIQ